MGIYYGNQIFGVKLINNGHDIYVYEKDEELNEEEKQNIKITLLAKIILQTLI